MSDGRERSLRLLLGVQLTQGFRSGIVSPILALFVRGQGLTVAQIGLIGTASMLADAELLDITHEVLTGLGFQEFVMKINNRKILAGIGQFAGVPQRLLGGLYRSIDKLERIGPRGVKKELRAKQIPDDVIPLDVGYT